METSVKERIKEFVKFKKIPVRQFCLSIGVSESFVSNMVKSIQPDKIYNISQQYPELNIEWLLTGKGEMLRNTGVAIAGDVKGDVLRSGNLNKNRISVELPESGSKKIIRPDGTVEIRHDDNDGTLERIKYLERVIESQKETIETLKELIRIERELKKD